MRKLHSQHNYEACEFLLNEGNYTDWVVTTAFYSALHTVYEEMFPHTDSGGNTFNTFAEYYSALNMPRSQRKSKHYRTIKLVEVVLPNIAPLYRNLFDMCHTCRYRNYYVSKKKATVAKSYLDKIRTTIGSTI